MDRKKFLILFGTFVVGGYLLAPNLSSAQSNLEEYCFKISPNKSIAMREVNTTPEQFLKENPDVEAVINGTYFGGNNSNKYRPEGIAYLAENHHFATEKPEHTRGYFSVNRKGDEIQVSENLEKTLNDYWMVIGTHPLLVVNGKIHSQANEKRYNERVEYRSAIGTKDKDVCFAVSNDKILMSEWANRLKNNEYKGAINLDGGPISQMAIRKNENILVEGKGKSNTRLVIFSYHK